MANRLLNWLTPKLVIIGLVSVIGTLCVTIISLSQDRVKVIAQEVIAASKCAEAEAVEKRLKELESKDISLDLKKLNLETYIADERRRQEERESVLARVDGRLNLFDKKLDQIIRMIK